MATDSRKAVFIIGPESSGSMLCARICAHALGIAPYGEWSAVGKIESETHTVIHRSLPYGLKSQYPNITGWIAEYGRSHDMRFVLTTRDRTISEISRRARFPKPAAQVRLESAKARRIMTGLMQSGHPFLVFSYESFLFLGKAYLDLLYDFIGIDSDFIPDLYDANKRRIMETNPTWLYRQVNRILKRN